MLRWLELFNKPLLLHLVGCLYYLYQWCTVKQISNNEIYLLIKYIKSVLWRVAKCLPYIEEARCLKVNCLLFTVTLYSSVRTVFLYNDNQYPFHDVIKEIDYTSFRNMQRFRGIPITTDDWFHDYRYVTTSLQIRDNLSADSDNLSTDTWQPLYRYVTTSLQIRDNLSTDTWQPLCRYVTTSLQ